MKKYNEIINYMNNYIDLLLEQNYSQEKSEILDIKSEIEGLRDEIYDYYNTSNLDVSFPYTFCRIVFDGEYELELPKYGLKKINRTLKGEMFFDIIGGSIEKNTIFLKTTSLENTSFEIKLTNFDTFELFKRQIGYANLVYNKIYEGNEEKIKFKFVNLK